MESVQANINNNNKFDQRKAAAAGRRIEKLPKIKQKKSDIVFIVINAYPTNSLPTETMVVFCRSENKRKKHLHCDALDWWISFDGAV